MTKFVIVDMDHTLADTYWRDHMIAHIPDGKGKRPEDFVEYNSLSSQDKPLEDVCWLVRTMAKEARIIVVTARPEMNRGRTMNDLKRFRVPCSFLLMRPDDEFCPSPLFKTSAVINFLRTYLQVHPEENWPPIFNLVSLVIDDREDVLEAFRALGVTTLQVRKGSFK